MFQETREFIKAPTAWNEKDYMALGIILAGSYGLMQVDEPIREFSKEMRSKLDFPMYFGRLYGEPFSPILLGTGLIMSGNSGNKKNKRIGFEILQSSFYSVIFTQITKMVLGRTRPFTEKGAFNFTFFNVLDNDFWSMPSGHTNIAFANSTILALNTDNTWLKILYYIPAAITGISRVYHDRHWSSDVFLGAIVGYYTARFVHGLHSRKKDQEIFAAPTTNIIEMNIPL